MNQTCQRCKKPILTTIRSRINAQQICLDCEDLEANGEGRLCKHGRPYVECGQCRATVVMAAAAQGQAAVDKDWEDEERKREHVSGALRTVSAALDALSDAQAHVKLDTVGTIPAEAGQVVDECLGKLRALRKELIRADAHVLMDHLDQTMGRALKAQGETELAEGFDLTEK